MRSVVYCGFQRVGIIFAPPALADDFGTCTDARGDRAIAACRRHRIRQIPRQQAFCPLCQSRHCLSQQGRPRPRYSRLQRSAPAPIRKAAKAYNNRGVAYYKKGDYDRAIADYNEALRLDPKDASAYNNRGSAYAGEGDHDRAIADYNEALRLDPKYVYAYYNRGSA